MSQSQVSSRVVVAWYRIEADTWDTLCPLAAIDNSLSFPWKHPDGLWRSYPYGWLWLPVSLIGCAARFTSAETCALLTEFHLHCPDGHSARRSASILFPCSRRQSGGSRPLPNFGRSSNLTLPSTCLCLLTKSPSCVSTLITVAGLVADYELTLGPLPDR
jgi:hypothetical protein